MERNGTTLPFLPLLNCTVEWEGGEFGNMWTACCEVLGMTKEKQRQPQDSLHRLLESKGIESKPSKTRSRGASH
jgi:hypothetical protein